MVSLATPVTPIWRLLLAPDAYAAFDLILGSLVLAVLARAAWAVASTRSGASGVFASSPQLPERRSSRRGPRAE